MGAGRTHYYFRSDRWYHHDILVLVSSQKVAPIQPHRIEYIPLQQSSICMRLSLRVLTRHAIGSNQSQAEEARTSIRIGGIRPRGRRQVMCGDRIVQRFVRRKGMAVRRWRSSAVNVKRPSTDRPGRPISPKASHMRCKLEQSYWRMPLRS